MRLCAKMRKALIVHVPWRDDVYSTPIVERRSPQRMHDTSHPPFCGAVLRNAEAIQKGSARANQD